VKATRPAPPPANDVREPTPADVDPALRPFIEALASLIVADLRRYPAKKRAA
jgi:hypothetical protein